MGGSKKLTPGGNWLWEDSRMMLQEHKQAHDRHRQHSKGRPRMELSEEQWSEVDRYFALSIQDRLPVNVSLYDPFGLRIVVGVVDIVHYERRRFLIDGRWYDIGDIEEVAMGERHSDDNGDE